MLRSLDIYTSNILAITLYFKAPTYESLKEAADKLAGDARNLAEDQEYMSPFAMKAQSFGLNLRGGKLDDITILLAAIVDNLEYPDR